ncbi:hypothetical protein GUITHDRAFT_90472 [Guillardia theta CCMP2712]|uniref:Membrane insertase YidC/Oxa/ALB C-terminal domain-containing protein n=1 Tax=Guillardia theta (strain CCMP2712) TaxID=905079 RepID=L1IDX8_GUITC|nr:hypothetical protein GUITHDRAFT_90472 [Guillardia theta CCMP2712]EKX34476.1 hypothetical protein GUITHDRAFT_90472 [Guillardia theta CCMP2712]|eukprot:XP_005821456.1 hypothetical protein GUITHDRAFT_90472 [Guillardia theta CCMP2712]
MMLLRSLVLAATAVAVHSFAPPLAAQASLRRLSPPSQHLPLTGMKKARGSSTRVQAVMMPGTEAASFLSLLHLADPSHLPADVAASTAALQDAMQLLSDAAAAAAETTEDKPGVFGSFVNLIVTCLTALHTAFKSAGIPGAWGYAIATFTIFVKAVTYPLNFKQMSSTIALQQLQPKVKAIQSRYANDPQTQNEKIAELYRTENVNPLAGCLPTLIQIPVFIGLYRSVLQLAQKDLLEESFLWIPSLQGPVGEYNAKTGLPIDATAWLFKGWTEGHPALGWDGTLAYLSLPIILVITQTLSQKILQVNKTQDSLPLLSPSALPPLSPF